MLSGQYLEQCTPHKQHIENQILVLLIFFQLFFMPIYVSSIDGIRKKRAVFESFEQAEVRKKL